MEETKQLGPIWIKEEVGMKRNRKYFTFTNLVHNEKKNELIRNFLFDQKKMRQNTILPLYL